MSRYLRKRMRYSELLRSLYILTILLKRSSFLELYSSSISFLNPLQQAEWYKWLTHIRSLEVVIPIEHFREYLTEWGIFFRFLKFRILRLYSAPFPSLPSIYFSFDYLNHRIIFGVNHVNHDWISYLCISLEYVFCLFQIFYHLWREKGSWITWSFYLTCIWCPYYLKALFHDDLHPRTIIVGALFLLLPFIVSGTLALFTLISIKMILLSLFWVLSIILFIFIVHLNSTLEIFIEATWYEAYILCKKEDKEYSWDIATQDHHTSHDTHDEHHDQHTATHDEHHH